jgi:hypothetical protein
MIHILLSVIRFFSLTYVCGRNSIICSATWGRIFKSNHTFFLIQGMIAIQYMYIGKVAVKKGHARTSPELDHILLRKIPKISYFKK